MQVEEGNIINVILSGYGLDHEFAVYTEIVEKCGLDFDDEYIDNESLLTPELLENHYDDILRLIRNNGLDYKDLPYSDKLVYMVLGALVIKTKAHLPEDLREKIIDSADWEFELRNRWRVVDDEFLERRKIILLDFQEKLKAYQVGRTIKVDSYKIYGGHDFEGEVKFLESTNQKSLDAITRGVLDQNLDKILDAIEKKPPYNIYEYLILGALILKTGASIPEELRQKIIEVAGWEKELRQRWTLRDEDFLRKRKEILTAFQDIIRKYE